MLEVPAGAAGSASTLGPDPRLAAQAQPAVAPVPARPASMARNRRRGRSGGLIGHTWSVRQRSSGPAMESGALPATLRWVDGDRSRDDPRLAAFGGAAPIPCPVEDCTIDPGGSLSPGRGLVGSGAGSANDVARHSSVRPSRHRVPSPSGRKCFTNSQVWQCSAPGPGASPISVGVSSRN